MRAAILESADAVLRCGEFPEPPPAEGREIVEVVAAGLHPVVRALATGTHYGSSRIWPAVPGIDGVARGSDGLPRYTGYPEPPYGSFAERVSVPAGMWFELPADADPVQVAAGMNPGLATWLPLTARAAAMPLGTVLVLGATATAGRLAVQNARHLGADRVVAVGRDVDALAWTAEHGATSTARLTGHDDAARIEAALEGRPPSIVLDLLWGAPAEAAFAALGRHGLDDDTADIAYVQVGASAGPDALLPAALLRSRRLHVSGTGAGSSDLSVIMKQLPVYLDLLGGGTITVPTRTFPLARAAEAWVAPTRAGERVVRTP